MYDCASFNTTTGLQALAILGFFAFGLRDFFRDCRAHQADYKTELFRPWKLITLALGMAWLIYGALAYRLPDWDVGISLLMGGYAYLVAPWCARAVFYRRWHLLGAVLIMYWIGVDSLYMLWTAPEVSADLRGANFTASSCLFWLAGFFWLPSGRFWRRRHGGELS